MNGQIKSFDETKYMSFLIKEELLKIHISRAKSAIALKKQFDSKPAYNKKNCVCVCMYIFISPSWKMLEIKIKRLGALIIIIIIIIISPRPGNTGLMSSRG